MITRILPDELEGEVNPRDYGFYVILVTRTGEEAILGAAQLYVTSEHERG